MDFRNRYRRMNEDIKPGEELVCKTLNSIKANTHCRKHYFRRIAAVSTAVILTAACVTPALAANVPGVYETLYGFSPAAAQFVMPAVLSFEDKGVEMRVDSVKMAGDSAEVAVTLRDISGKIFGDNAPDLLDSYSLNYPSKRGQSCGCVLENYNPSTSTATYSLTITNFDGEKYPKGKYTFSIKELLIGRRKQEGVEVVYDFSKTSDEPEMETRFINGASYTDSSGEWIMNKQEYGFLKPQGVFWESEDGNFSLVAAGYMDGKLHLQYKTLDSLKLDNHAFFHLAAPDGSDVLPDYTVTHMEPDEDASYSEFVYAIPYGQLAGCSLYADLYTAADKISGNWRVTFLISDEES